MAKKKVFCVGTAAVDVKGCPHREILQGSTVPGTTGFSVGGIARNIAENLSRLDCETYLLSFVGADIFGEFVVNETSKVGVHTEYVERCTECVTALRVALLDAEGEMQYAVFGDEIFKHFSPSYLKHFSHLLSSADLLVTQTSLSVDSLTFLANIAQENAIPLYINATSVPLANRLLEVIDKTPLLGVNQKEAEILTVRSITSAEEAIEAGKILLSLGAKEVIITLGPKGVVYCKRNLSLFYSPFPAKIIDTTGAGDALCSGFLSCLLHDQTAEHCLEYGLAAASLTVESTNAVSPLLSNESIQSRIETISYIV